MTAFRDSTRRSAAPKKSSLRAQNRDGWIARAVFRLDAWLRRREAVFEYTDDPECIFRIQKSHAGTDILLRDKTVVGRGDPTIVLHLWNEQMPVMSADGASVAWGREVGRKIGTSLAELDRYLDTRPEFDEFRVISADVALGTAIHAQQILRLAGRYGFDGADENEHSAGMHRRLGENILMLLLALATNPASARPAVLLRCHRPVYLSRQVLHANAERIVRSAGRTESK